MVKESFDLQKSEKQTAKQTPKQHGDLLKNISPGDTLKIQTEDEVLTGRYLQRAEIFDPNILVLKLENGYNIGINKNKIKSVSVLEPYKPLSKEQIPLKQNTSLPTVALISFGGTISSKLDYRTGGVSAEYTAADFVQMIPELASIANLQTKHSLSIMSEDMTPSHWELIAKELKPYLDDPNIVGIVATQGTDTLHFSTAAISFALQNLSKPIIFTAAQRSIDRGSSDAFLNVLCAVKAAAEFDGAVVATCMHETTHDDSCILIRGTKVRKMHTSRRDAFRPINEQALAKVTPAKITVLNPNYPKRNMAQASLFHPKFSAKVGMLLIHPGISPKIVEHYITEKYDGLVIGATALGHVPHDLVEVLGHATQSGMFVVIATQTIYGRVHPFVYSRLRDMSITHKLLFADDMLFETAYVKACWVCAQEADSQKRKELFTKNIAGEFTAEIDAKSYLN